MSQNFVVVSGAEFNRLSELRDSFAFQDSFTLATIYSLKDGRAIAYPAVGSKCIIAESVEIMKEILRKGFPVKEDNPNPFQKDQNKIINIPETVDDFLSQISTNFNIEINLADTSEAYYLLIDKAINKNGKGKAYQQIFIALGVFVGEKIRRDVSGSWKLETHYAYNPYYEPYIQGKDGRIYRPWYYLSRMLLEKKNFSIKKCLQLTKNFGMIE